MCKLIRRFPVLEPLEPRRFFAVSIAIDAAQRFQQIDGFGTSMAWWRPGVYDQPAWLDSYYKDLGSSMLRMDLNINALPGTDGDLATPVTMGADLQANIDQFNWQSIPTTRFGGVAQAAASRKIDDFKLIGSIWSPPQWMKGVERNPNTGASNGVMPVLIENTLWGYSIWDSSGGSLIDTPENLQQFGRYVAAYVKGFEQKFGVAMYAVSIANEPAFHEPYSSAVYDPALYVKAIKAVGDAFDTYGITTKIMGPEDVGVGPTNNPWILKRQMKYIEAIRADAEAMADVDLYTIHGYANDGVSDNRSAPMWSQYWNGRSQAAYPSPSGAWWTGIKNDGKKSYMTEISGQSQSWTGALSLAANAQDAMVQGNVSAWLYWQLSDGDKTSNYALTKTGDTTQPKYVAAKQFFRYIRPGAVRVNATPSDPNGVYVSAFVQDAQKTLTSVLVNLGATDQTINLSIGGTNLSSFNIARQSTASAVWTDLGPIAVSNGTATLTLPAQSIVTIQGGIVPPAGGGSIGGALFNDIDADGVKDTGETALANWKVFLDTNKNAAVDPGEAMVLTDSSGNYRFTGLASGSYRVREVTPSGWRVTTPSNSRYDINLATGQSVSGKNFGNTQNVKITGTIWNDLDSDRVRDSGEAVLVNWKVFVDTDRDGVLDTGEVFTTTNSAGVYSFDTLPAGNYRIRQVVPAGWRVTSPSSGYSELTLAAGQVALGKNFGDTQKILISGTVFNDKNGNGAKNTGEYGMAGWRVFADGNKNGIFDAATESSVLTDSAGNWSLKTLSAGTWSIAVVQQGAFILTTPAGGSHSITLGNGASVSGKLFGEK
jgi:O-glycosyl hydrolase